MEVRPGKVVPHGVLFSSCPGLKPGMDFHNLGVRSGTFFQWPEIESGLKLWVAQY